MRVQGGDWSSLKRQNYKLMASSCYKVGSAVTWLLRISYLSPVDIYRMIGLTRVDPLIDIYSASPSHRRECTYYIAVGYYKLKQYGHARKFNG